MIVVVPLSFLKTQLRTYLNNTDLFVADITSVHLSNDMMSHCTLIVSSVPGKSVDSRPSPNGRSFAYWLMLLLLDPS